MRYVAVVSMLVVLLLGVAENARSAPVLFGDFLWGTPKNELAGRQELSPGEGNFAGDLFLPGAIFADLPWNARLEFADDRLVRVSLMAQYSRQRMDAVTGRLRADKFEMLSVLIDASFLDLVKILKLRGPDGVREEWARFVKDKTPERMVYAWFETTGMSRDMKTMAGSLRQLLLMGPAETREAEVILLRDPAASAPDMLLVDFSFPLMDGAAPGDAGRKPAQQE